VLDEVRINLDLGVLNDSVHRWWLSACDSARDPEGRRRTHARAATSLAGDFLTGFTSGFTVAAVAAGAAAFLAFVLAPGRPVTTSPALDAS
jgi:hypothetical protein